MSRTAYVNNALITSEDLERLKEMAVPARLYASLHTELSDGCNHALFELHNEETSLNHIARWIEQNTDEAVERLENAFAS